MTNPNAPKVFISHATEDKQKFVLKFAEQLRKKGVDAWLDKWEMQPGDKLVDRIFEQGIGEADAFIVILSSVSVSKPWVKEELDAAFVKRIGTSCKIIPIVIDECEVPVCLQSTFWVKIHSLDDYQDELKQIINALYGLSEKPSLGVAPHHVDLPANIQEAGLNKLDLMVLEALCEASVESGHPFVNDLGRLQAMLDSGVSAEELRDSLEVLESNGHLECGRVISGGLEGTGVSHVRLCVYGFDCYAKQKWPNYNDILEELIVGIVNKKWATESDVNQLSTPNRLGDHLIRVLEDSGLVELSRHMGGYSIWKISPELKRAVIES